MSDPIPSAATADPTPAPAPSTSAEDRKAAAALSSLNTTEIASDSTAAADVKQPSLADQEALGKAMSRLEIAAGAKGKGKAGGNENGNGKAATDKSEDAGGLKGDEKKKVAAVKVAAEDVGLLVCDVQLCTSCCGMLTWKTNELDLSKVKATELLKANEGDARKAIRAFIRPRAAAA